MAFCKYCGSPLEPGQICSCPQAQADAQAAPQPVPETAPQAAPQPAPEAAPPAAPQAALETAPQTAPQAQPNPQLAQAQQAAKEGAKNLVSYLKAYFTSPVQAVQTLVQDNNMTLAVILTVIRVLSMSLAIWGLFHGFCSTVSSLLTSANSSFALVSINASLLSCLLYGTLIAIIGMALFILVDFALVKLLHGSASIQNVFVASAGNGIITTGLLLLAFLCSFFSLTLCLLFLIISCLSWAIFGILTAMLTCPDSRSFLFWGVYLAGVLVAIFIGYKVFPALLFNAFSATSISGPGVGSFSLKDIFAAANLGLSEFFGEFSSSWEDLLEGLFSSFGSKSIYGSFF